MMIPGPRISNLFGDDLRRVVLVGQAPSRSGDATVPCGGSFMRRLLAGTGLGEDDYADTFDRANLLAHWPGPDHSRGGDLFPRRDARAAAGRLLPYLRYRLVVIAGRAAERALSLRPRPWFEWWTGPTWCVATATIPHPSGLCQIWNDEANRRRLAEFVRRCWRVRRYGS